MDSTSQGRSRGQLCSTIKAAEDILADRKKAIEKARATLSKGRRQLTKSDVPLKALTQLAQAIHELPQEPAGPDLKGLAAALLTSASEVRGQFTQAFQADIRRHAREAGLEVRVSDDLLTVGPFSLAIDLADERATLEYAKAPIETRLPLSANQIVATAVKLARIVLEPPDNFSLLAADFEEAVRICLVRQKKATNISELRAELPAVFREMTFIRQNVKRALTKSSFKEYWLARFVVEVKALVQADENLAADRTFRLETAVLDNAGNPRKSVFIPKDLSVGCGEGMYYQALVLRYI